MVVLIAPRGGRQARDSLHWQLQGQEKAVGQSEQSWLQGVPRGQDTQLTALCHPISPLGVLWSSRQWGLKGGSARPVRQREVQKDKMRLCPTALASPPAPLPPPSRVPDMLDSTPGPPSTWIPMHPAPHPIFICHLCPAMFVPSSSYLGL